MPEYDVPQCSLQALVRFGVCVICWRHFCWSHLKDKSQHDCIDLSKGERSSRMVSHQREADDAIIAKIDVPALTHEAYLLRGVPCAGPTEPLTTSGSALVGQGSNYHVPLTFEDGVKWMVRMKRYTWDGPNLEVLRMTAMSEVATLQTMKEKGLAVPGAWFPLQSEWRTVTWLTRGRDDFVYFFEDFLPGTAMTVRRDSMTTATTPRDMLYLRSLARFFLSLETLRFERFGSLHRSPAGEISVGPWTRYFVSQTTRPYFGGPFRTAKQMYLSLLDDMLRQTLDGLRYPAGREIEGYLAILETKTLVAGCIELEGELGYLKHGDDKGIITWSFITCKADAFAPPYALTDRSFVHTGSNAPTPREQAVADIYAFDLHRPDLAAFVRNGKKFQRLYEFLRYERMRYKSMNAMRRAFLGRREEQGPCEPGTKEEWVNEAVLRYQGDEGLQVLLEKTKGL